MYIYWLEFVFGIYCIHMSFYNINFLVHIRSFSIILQLITSTCEANLFPTIFSSWVIRAAKPWSTWSKVSTRSFTCIGSLHTKLTCPVPNYPNGFVDYPLQLPNAKRDYWVSRKVSKKTMLHTCFIVPTHDYGKHNGLYPKKNPIHTHPCKGLDCPSALFFSLFWCTTSNSFRTPHLHLLRYVDNDLFLSLPYFQRYTNWSRHCTVCSI